MPYTPPSQQSPVASKPSSPNNSRTHSHSRSVNHISINGPRPGLPRSSSSTAYLHKRRRSPSLPSPTQVYSGQYSPDALDDTMLDRPFREQLMSIGGSSVRQSPPPLSDASMPPGAVISPPDSTQNSSDDEETDKRGRVRKLENLAELQAAISAIEQHREGSPDKVKEEVEKVKISLGLHIPEKKDQQPKEMSSVSKDFSQTRKSSHTRSITESAIVDFDRPKTESPNRSSDSDLEDDERIHKPPMLRKKSGELVRPALRPASAKRRPSSMPGTPTYSKAVHFDSHLEHVRHFLQVVRPTAVSANSSPVETYEGETEFPFGASDKQRHSAWQWDIKLPNFPRDSLHRKQQPIHVEKVFLSSNCKILVGTVAVQNLAFHKTVIARFTLDHWKTTSEVTAEYNNDTRRPNDGLDRFNFNVKLEDLANIENRTLFFCVRYVVNGQEFWDSNGNVNFQVNFAKKAVPQTGKQGTKSNTSEPLNSLPRSRPSHQHSSSKPRPKSASSFDDFAHGLESFPPPFANFNDTPIRFRNRTSGNESEPVSPTLKKKSPTQAFGNRYDFGASLSAAMQSASDALGDKSGFQLKPTRFHEVNKPEALNQELVSNLEKKEIEGKPQEAAAAEPSKPAALTQDKPDVKSQSYNELLDKYCFFGSAKTSPQQSKPENGQLDGSEDAVSEYSLSRSGSAKNSPDSSPPQEQIPVVQPTSSSRISRPTSAAISFGSRAASPIFGYPYHQPMQHGIFSDTQTTTAILG